MRSLISLESLEGRAGRPCELGRGSGRTAGGTTTGLRRQDYLHHHERGIAGSGCVKSHSDCPNRAPRGVGGAGPGCVIDGYGAALVRCPHIVHWVERTDLPPNLVLLCRCYHTLVHEG